MTDVEEGVPSILAGIPQADERDDCDMRGNEVPGLHAGTSDQNVKPPFRTMSYWRNLVRAWEMRNYHGIKSRGWNGASDWQSDPHPAEMTILTQGTTMTPTVMLEGRWDTWSYADLMNPEAFFEMLKKDGLGQDKLHLSQKQFKWVHIIKPLCASLGYQLMFSEERPIFPQDGEGYYQLMAEGMITFVRRRVRVPDASIQERAERFAYFDGICRFPHSIENKNDKQRQVYDDSKSGVQKALYRYGTLQLHDALSAITDWSQHRAVLPDRVHAMAIWVGQTKDVDGEEMTLDASFQGRSPLLFVRSTSSTRRSEKDPEGRPRDSKKRRVESETMPSQKTSIVSLSGLHAEGVDTEQMISPSGLHAEGAVTTSQSEGNEGSIISGRSSSAAMYQASKEWEEEPQPVIEPTKELKPMDDQQELNFWKIQWAFAEQGATVHTNEGTPSNEFFDRKSSRMGRVRRDELLPLCVYLLPRYPLNKYDRSIRLGQKYDPSIQLTTKNLIGTLALDPKREVAWMTMRRMIQNTSSAWENAVGEDHRRGADYILSRLSEFNMQTKHERQETELVPIHDIVQILQANENVGSDILRHRATSTGTRFVEEVVMWLHVIGRIILPCLVERGKVWRTVDLESFFRLL
eukprot:2348292-Amphidinium_carterae.2